MIHTKSTYIKVLCLTWLTEKLTGGNVNDTHKVKENENSCKNRNKLPKSQITISPQGYSSSFNRLQAVCFFIILKCICMTYTWARNLLQNSLLR